MIYFFFVFLNLTYSLTVTQQEVVDFVLKNSKEIREIELEQKKAATAMPMSRNLLDWNFTAGTNYEDSRAKTLSPFANEKDERLNFDLGIEKKISTGTTFSFNYARKSQDSLLNPITSTNIPDFSSVRHLDTLSLKIEQELLKNSFGYEDRRTLRIGQIKSEKSVLEKLEQVEALVLATLETYWSTYVAKESLQASIDARDRYKKLVDTVRAKKRLGYSNPGELSQALAELEEREQAVKTASSSYLKLTDEVYRQLQLQRNSEEIHFKISELVPEIPMKNNLSLDNLRALRVQDLDLEIGEAEYESILSSTRPNISLVLQSTLTGADSSAGEAWSEATSGTHPIHYVGVTFTHTPFSQAQEGQRGEKYFAKEKTRIARDKTKETLVNDLAHAERDAISKQLVAKSAIKSLEYRQQAAKEIERAFKQGRSDISTLIQVYNSLSDTHTKQIRALGDYHIALNTLAALRDELVRNN